MSAGDAIEVFEELLRSKAASTQQAPEQPEPFSDNGPSAESEPAGSTASDFRVFAQRLLEMVRDGDQDDAESQAEFVRHTLADLSDTDRSDSRAQNSPYN